MASIDFKTSSAEAASLVSVEQNMRLRRGRLYSALTRDEVAPTLTAFPLMGVADFTMPRFEANGPAAQSSSVPDECINPHPRGWADNG